VNIYIQNLIFVIRLQQGGETMDINESGFKIIMHSGDARSHTLEALKNARKGNFEKAEQLLKDADDQLLEAHKIQTSLLHEEANGRSMKLSIIFVHAQDHLMTAMLAKDLATEIIAMQQAKTL
jgi:cellobiose PTS system EIIA component